MYILNKLKSNSKRISTIILVILLLIATIISTILCVKRKIKMDEILSNPESKRYLYYKEVESKDEDIEGNDYVKFNAYFLKDIDKDGRAESFYGTCNPCDGSGLLNMEIKVLAKGTLKNAKINIDGKNFHYETSIVEDDYIKGNIIGQTNEIDFNTLSTGTQKIIEGNIYPELNNNINNYSRDDNTITLTGTYVDDNGNESTISKTVTLTAEWYGDVGATVKLDEDEEEKNNRTIDYILGNMEHKVIINFTVKTQETKQQLLIKNNTTYGTIPELYGYAPESVEITGGEAEYNSETREFKVQNNAKVDENGNITDSVGNYYNGIYNTYNFKIVYPEEAYNEIKAGYDKSKETDEEKAKDTSKIEELNKLELNIPIATYYEGYNNPNEGFENPKKSNEDSTTIVLLYGHDGGKIYVAVEIGECQNKYNRYMPYYKEYLVSKKSLIQGSEDSEKISNNDTYDVSWYVENGYDYEVKNIELKEKMNDGQLSDKVITNSAEEISFENYVTNTGFYVTGLNSLLTEDTDKFRVYNDETDELIVEIGKDNVNNYSTSSNKFTFNEPIKHVRVELTRMPKKSSPVQIYFTRRFDDSEIIKNYTLEQIKSFETIMSYMDCYDEGKELGVVRGIATLPDESSYVKFDERDEKNEEAYSYRVDRTSEVTLNFNTIQRDDYEFEGWKNSIFLIKVPSQIIKTELEEVKSSSSDVEIDTYELIENEEGTFIKITTKNDTEEAFRISIKMNITPNPETPSGKVTYEMYAYNESATQYYNKTKDTYDVNSNDNTEENVGYAETFINLYAPSGLITYEMLSDFDDNNTIVFGPNEGKIDKFDKDGNLQENKTAKVTISTINNYNNGGVKNLKIIGRIPFKDNKYVIVDEKLGSAFDTTITNEGIQLPDEIKNYAKIYYSENGEATNDLSNSKNGWTEKSKITDLSKVKSYLIDLGEYTLKNDSKLNITYNIQVLNMKNLKYNDISYSTHAIYFDRETTEGLYATNTESNKLGVSIAREYKLNLTKYQIDTETKVKGATFKLTEISTDENGNESYGAVKTGKTDANGLITFKKLKVEKTYELEETSTPDDYELNTNKVRFIVNVDNNGKATMNVISGQVRGAASFGLTDKEYVGAINIEDEVRPRLQIKKVDTEGNALKDVYFRLEGKDKNREIQSTDENGILEFKNLILNEEYTLSEVEAKGYFLNKDIKFKITKQNGKYVEEITEGNSKSHSVVLEGSIPCLALTIENEKAPTFTLEVKKVAEKSDSKVLQGASFELINNESGEKQTGTSNEEGLIDFTDLVPFVEGKSSKGEFTLKETKSPSGYIDSEEEIDLKITKKSDDTYSGEATNKDNLKTFDSITVDGSKVIVTIKNTPYFKLTKIDSETQEPLAGVKFVIREVDENKNDIDYAKDIDGKYVGKKDASTGMYIVTTDENGEILLPLKDGNYSAAEISTKEGYELSNKLEYFKVGNEDSLEKEIAEKKVNPRDSMDISKIKEESMKENDISNKKIKDEDLAESKEIQEREKNYENTLEINYIEDLIDLSNNIKNGNNYEKTKIVLNKDLDFNDDNSYKDNTSTKYGDYNNDGTISTIKEECTTGTGFQGIGSYVYSEETITVGNEDSNNGTNETSNTTIANSTSNTSNTATNTTSNTASTNETNTLATNSTNTTTNTTSDSASTTTKIVTTYKSFNGIFDGNGHTIKNLLMKATSTTETKTNEETKEETTETKYYPVALFGYLNSSLIENLTIDGNITGSGEGATGFTISPRDSILYKLTNNAQISDSNSKAVTGVAFTKDETSEYKVTIVSCTNNGKITAEEASSKMGMAGIYSEYADEYKDRKMNINELTIDYCANYGEIDNSINTNQCAGGIVGFTQATKVTLTNNYNYGKLNQNKNTGGIGGEIYYNIESEIEDETIIKSNYNYGEIIENNSIKTTEHWTNSSICGIVGYIYNRKNIDIEECYNYSDIKSETEKWHIAGIMDASTYSSSGNCIKNFKLINNYNFGNIFINNSLLSGIAICYGIKSGATAMINENNNYGQIGKENENSSSSWNAGILVAQSISGTYVEMNNNNNYGDVIGSYCTAGIGGMDPKEDKKVFEMCNNNNYGNIGDKTASSSTDVAGIASYGGTKVCDNNNYGTIYGSSYTSGIVGCLENAEDTEFEISRNNNYGDLDINSSSVYSICGIIGELYKGKAKDFSENYNYGNITTNSSTDSYIGGIIGQCNYVENIQVTIKNCDNYGHITLTGNNSPSIGGIIGYGGNNTVIENCNNYGNLYGVSRQSGGIVGSASSIIIKNCNNYGDIFPNKNSSYLGYMGGIVGESSKINISNSSNYGTIYYVGTYVGGIGGDIGYSGDNNILENCFNYGDLIDSISNYSYYSNGGIVGYGNVEIKKCANYGDIIIGENNSNSISVNNLGGIIGGGTSKPISDVYNEGNIEINATKINQIVTIGGISGSSPSSKITNAINFGTTNTHVSICGTMVGFYSSTDQDYNTYTNCYYAYEKGYNLLQGEKVSIQETRSKDFFNKINSNDAWERELGKTPNLKGVDKTFIKKQTSLTIRNTKEKYNVIVDVLSSGGNIAGYTSKTILETVNKGADSTKEIKITPDDSYQIAYILLNGKQYAFTANEDKTFTMPQFTNMQEDKLIEVSFVKNPVTITKQDSETEEKLKGAKFKIEEQNTNTDISNAIGKIIGNIKGYSADTEDTDGLENVLGEMTNTTSYGFVKQSDGSYIPQNGYAYQKLIGKSNSLEANAESYMKIDLSSFPTTEKYKINLRASHTYDPFNESSLYAKITQSTNSISSSLNEGCFIKTSAKFENKKYSSDELQGGKIYYLHIYFKVESSYYKDDASIKELEIVHLTKNTGTKYYNFEEKDGKYVSTNGGIADTDCESYIPIDLSENTGTYILSVSALTTGPSKYDTGSEASIYLTDSTDENAKALYNFSTNRNSAYMLNGKQKYYLYFKYHEGNDLKSSYYVIQDTDNLTINSIQLDVKEAGYSAEVVTDDEGKVKFDLPYYGDFKITETEAPEGYSTAEPVMYSYTADASTEVVIKDEKIGKLNVHHYMKKADGTYTTTKLAEDENSEGSNNEKYTTSPKLNINKFTLEKDTTGNYVIPQNASGTYEGGKTIDVTYYYEPLKATSVKVKYLDKETNEPLHEEKTLTGYVGDYYSEKPISITGYVLEPLPENREGKMTEDTIEVIFYYSKNTNIVVKYVDKYTNEEIADEEKIEGISGREYNAEDKQKEIEGYVYVENSGNVSGIFKNEPIEIIFYYNKKLEITVKYIDVYTEEEIAEEEKIEKVAGEEYNVEDKKKEIDGYMYLKDTGNTKGTLEHDSIEISYFYVKTSKVIVKIIDVDTNQEIKERIIIDGYQGKDYEVTPPKKDGYTYTGSDGELKGKMEREDKVITLKYKRKKDETFAPIPIPQTGEKILGIFAIISIVVLSTILGIKLIRNKKDKN